MGVSFACIFIKEGKEEKGEKKSWDFYETPEPLSLTHENEEIKTQVVERRYENERLYSSGRVYGMCRRQIHVVCKRGGLY